MKKFFCIVRSQIHWLLFVLACDAFFVGALWLVDARALKILALSLILFTLGSFALVCALLWHRENRMAQVFSDYLREPTDARARILLSRLSGYPRSRMETLLKLLGKAEREKGLLLSQNEDYEEYVESWAHEAKTPIALLTMILDNNQEDMDPDMVYKIEYIRSRLSESVEQMLQYARIKGERKDYLFEKLCLRAVVDEVLEEYRPLLSEKNILAINELGQETIFADRRALRYMLGQFVSNSIKYSSDDPKITFSAPEKNCLKIEDNGIGVKKADLPYIFERGFTGNTGEKRGKATGMGLYLAKKLADDMRIDLNVTSETGKGFTVVVQYPDVSTREEE